MWAFLSKLFQAIFFLSFSERLMLSRVGIWQLSFVTAESFWIQNYVFVTDKSLQSETAN